MAMDDRAYEPHLLRVLLNGCVRQESQFLYTIALEHGQPAVAQAFMGKKREKELVLLPYFWRTFAAACPFFTALERERAKSKKKHNNLENAVEDMVGRYWHLSALQNRATVAARISPIAKPKAEKTKKDRKSSTGGEGARNSGDHVGNNQIKHQKKRRKGTLIASWLWRCIVSARALDVHEESSSSAEGSATDSDDIVAVGDNSSTDGLSPRQVALRDNWTRRTEAAKQSGFALLKNMQTHGTTQLFDELRAASDIDNLAPEHAEVIHLITYLVVPHLVRMFAQTERLRKAERMYRLFPRRTVSGLMRITSPVKLLGLVSSILLARPFGARNVLQRQIDVVSELERTQAMLKTFRESEICPELRDNGAGASISQAIEEFVQAVRLNAQAHWLAQTTLDVSDSGGADRHEKDDSEINTHSSEAVMWTQLQQDCANVDNSCHKWVRRAVVSCDQSTVHDLLGSRMLKKHRSHRESGKVHGRAGGLSSSERRRARAECVERSNDSVKLLRLVVRKEQKLAFSEAVGEAGLTELAKDVLRVLSSILDRVYSGASAGKMFKVVFEWFHACIEAAKLTHSGDRVDASLKDRGSCAPRARILSPVSVRRIEQASSALEAGIFSYMQSILQVDEKSGGFLEELTEWAFQIQAHVNFDPETGGAVAFQTDSSLKQQYDIDVVALWRETPEEVQEEIREEMRAYATFRRRRQKAKHILLHRKKERRRRGVQSDTTSGPGVTDSAESLDIDEISRGADAARVMSEQEAAIIVNAPAPRMPRTMDLLPRFQQECQSRFTPFDR